MNQHVINFFQKNFKTSFFLLLLALGFINFSSSLNHPFLIDDNVHYLDPKKTNLKFLQFLVTPDLKNKPGFREYEDYWVYYRPLTHVFYALQANLFHDNPVYYHLACIIFFVVCCFSIYLLVFQITSNQIASAIAAILYLLHPFNGLHVNYKTAIIFSLQTLLLNICFIYALKVIQGKKVLTWWGLGGVFLAYLSALLMHELAFILPILLFFYAVIFHLKNLNKQFIVLFLSLSALAGGYFVFRLINAKISDNLLNGMFAYKISPYEFCAAYARIIRYVIEKLFFPQQIFLQWITPVDKFMAPQWIWVFMAYIVSFIALTIIFFRNNKVLLFFWLMFGLGFCLAVPGTVYTLSSGNLFFEPHWVFYTHIGVFAIFGILFSQYVLLYPRLFFSLTIILSAIILCFSISQNKLYAKVLTYASAWSKEVPGYDLPISLMCRELALQQDLDKAIACSQSLIASPRRSLAYSDLGDLYLVKREFQKSEMMFNRLLENGEVNTLAYYGLARVAYEQKKYKEALAWLAKAQEYDKLSLKVLSLQAQVYHSLKERENLEKILLKTVEYYPFISNIYLDAVEFHLELGQQEKVKNWVNKFCLNIKDIDAYLSLTVLLMKNHQDALAQQVYLIAYQIDRKSMLKKTRLNLK